MAQTGFCYKVIPAARVSNANVEGRRVIESTLSLIETLPNRDSKRYVVGMDNFFIWPRTIVGARALKVAIVDTARGKCG